MPSNKKKKGTGRRSTNNKKNNKSKKKNVAASSSSAVARGSTTVPPRTPAVRGRGTVFSAQRPMWTEEQIRSRHGEESCLNEFPMSKYFVIGYNLYCCDEKDDADNAYRTGAEEDSCVWCIYRYAEHFSKEKIHRAFPWYLEGALRGHNGCIARLYKYCYEAGNVTDFESPISTIGLKFFWCKMMNEINPTTVVNDNKFAEDQRKENRDSHRSECAYCGSPELSERHLCEGCRYMSYCSKECQRADWKEEECNHRGECRQLKILKHNYRKHRKAIRDAVTNGIDPKTIEQLQTIRTRLGLNRPEEDYEELLQFLDDDSTKNTSLFPNRYVYFTGRPRDGTVWIGSTPSLM